MQGRPWQGMEGAPLWNSMGVVKRPLGQVKTRFNPWDAS